MKPAPTPPIAAATYSTVRLSATLFNTQDAPIKAPPALTVNFGPIRSIT
jgi:hypothetical protein